MQQLAPPEFIDTPMWTKLNKTFNSLEREAETAIRSIIQQASVKSRTSHAVNILENAPMSLGRQSLQALKKYLLFLRFRNVNVDRYKALVERAKSGILFGRHRKRAQSSEPSTPLPSSIPSPMSRASSLVDEDDYDDLANWILLSESFVKFFEGGTYGESNTHQFNFVHETIHRRFSSIQEVELCVGMASEPDEFILNESCFGVVDDGGSATAYA